MIKTIKHYISDPRLVFSYLGRHGYLRWMPDRAYLSIRYRMFMGKPLNLEDPQTFNEKIQWLKLYDRNPLYSKLVDKILVKEYISSRYPELKLIPTIGVWDRAEDIDFDGLPDQFVLKCNHDSNSVVICKDRKTFDYDHCRKKLNAALKRNFYDLAREWAYRNVKPQIMAEPYMGTLRDYKYFCFHGEPKMIQICDDLDNHDLSRRSFFDFDGHEKPFQRKDFVPMGHDVELPVNADRMVEIAMRMAKDLHNPFSRIDLYPIDEEIFFSEITLYPANGLIQFEPEEADLELGRMINLPDITG